MEESKDKESKDNGIIKTKNWLTSYLFKSIYDAEWEKQRKEWPDHTTYSKEDWEIEFERRNKLWHSHIDRVEIKLNKWLSERFEELMTVVCESDNFNNITTRIHFLLSDDSYIEDYPISREVGCKNIKFRDHTVWGLNHPIPPSVNKMYVSRSNKIVKSKVYNDWLYDNLEDFEYRYEHSKTGWAESLGVEIIANLPRNRDLDNIVKPIIDAFVMAKIIPDDNFVDFVLIRRSKAPPKGYFQINISEPFENDKYWHE